MSGLKCTIFVLLISVIFTCLVPTNGNHCCEFISSADADKPCRDACFKLTESVGLVDQITQLEQAKTQCSQYADKLWECAESKLSVLQELGTTPGRPCKDLAKTRSCREACETAKSEQEIEEQCSRSTEDAELFQCISRQKDGEKCCGKTITLENFVCVATCWNLYLTNTVAQSDSRRDLRLQCGGRNKNVVQCVQRQTRSIRPSNHVKIIHCCQQTTNATCRTVCEEALQSEGKAEEKFELVSKGCGKPGLMDPLWQCLLKEDDQPQDTIPGIDSAKLHCCDKAQSPICGSLCVKTHGWKWASIHKFEKNCVYISSSISPSHESEMHVCLKEVEEPCQMGCNGLSFCTNMNNRPTELFRSCNKNADEAARNEILMWQQGTVTLPGAEIPIKDIRKCEPEMWKAIACSYQIKPCYKNPAPPQICQEDCVHIMQKCVDKAQLQDSMKKGMCNRLPPAASGNCTSIEQYLYSKPAVTSVSLSTPCKPNPCDEDTEVCLVRRRKCHNKKDCKPYVCRKGCKLGHVSKVVVPHNTNVLVPTFQDSEISNSCQHYKVCHCSHRNNDLGNCKSMRCLSKSKCFISSEVRKAHAEHYKSDCNDCVCFGGEQICTKRLCPASPGATNVRHIGILDCDCSREYKPVCGENGKTYPSACVARCYGQIDLKQGPCSARDPCQNDTCAEGYRCVRQQSVCIGQRHDQCIQYLCVKLDDCNEHLHQPVCDTDGIEHTNECILLAQRKVLAYRGHCMTTNCQMIGRVCGHNGETYSSECAALAARTTVDYLGECRSVGTVPLFGLTEKGQPQCEGVIECRPVRPAGCRGIVPPWGCCPVCATELRVLFSESMAYDLVAAVRKGPIRIGEILETLSMSMSVADCDVYGYLSVDGEILVLVAPVSETPSMLQMDACMTEAERLEYVINSRSPLFSSNMLLTPLIRAVVSRPEITRTSGGASVYTQSYIVILTLSVLHLTHKILRNV